MTVFPILATTGYVQADENMLPKWLVPCQIEHANAGNSQDGIDGSSQRLPFQLLARWSLNEFI